ncbi:MAG: PEP-utilizing enzyme, partial [Candidatus Micrarchaeota archaeon]|nr:PEP-utilizing enzyme [Candidatus Micrarchaeota archaeon]
YSDLRNYSAQSLVEGKPRRFGKDFALATYAGESVMLDKPLIAYAKAREADSVKGMAAFKGVVRGTVKVLKSTSELGKVRQGDILVTQMTFPAFLPAMMRAAAFVTDEGGITCHAAIVAREMRKPCITGTKIATRVFKDGDFIEVDAEKGVARKIRR